MNFNEYLEEAYNDLLALEPEWAEVAEPQSAINIIAQILALYKPTIESIYTEMINNCSIDTADFQHLIRAYGGISKVYYKNATNTTYEITIEANADDVLPSGWTISDNAGNSYQLTKDTQIYAGTNKITFSAVETGAITSLKNTITNINQPRTSVLSITNEGNPTYVGQEAESEEAYRTRCKAEQQYSTGTSKTLTNELINEAGCSRVLVIWNSENKIIHNWIRPYSYAVITYGGSDDKIAEVIGSHRIIKDNSMNPDTEKTQLLEVEEEEINGVKSCKSELLVGWTPATILPYYVQVKLSATLPDNILLQLKQAIVSYVQDNVLEDFNNELDSATFIYIINDFLIKNSYSSVKINECLLSTDNKTWKDKIAPEQIDELLTINMNNILIEQGE